MKITNQHNETVSQRYPDRNNIADAKSGKTIGVVPSLEDTFTKEDIEGMKQGVSSFGYQCFIAQSLNSSENERRKIHSFFKMALDGLVDWLADESKGATDISHFSKKAYQSCKYMIDQGEDQHIVLSQACTCYEAVTHLLEQHCRQIMLAADYSHQHVGEAHLLGYQKALKTHLIPLGETLLIQDSGRVNGTEVANKIIAGSTSNDGIIFSDCIEPMRCMLKLQTRGIMIPKDIALVSLNDHPFQPKSNLLYLSSNSTG